MRIDYLIYFLNVTQTRSINISAKQLYISQQSLSLAIKTLEEEIGAPLLKRHYYGVELTEVGEIVSEYAGRIVKEHYAMRKSLLPYLEPVSEAFTGRLRLGINYHIINEVLHTIVHTFVRQNPGVRFSVSEHSVEWMRQALMDGELDLALFGDWEEENPSLSDSLICEELYRADMLVCVSQKSSLSAKRVIRPEELLTEPLIQYENQSITEKFFKGYGNPRILLETSSTELFRQMVQDGAGYGLTNRLDWQEDYSFAEKSKLSVIPVSHPHAAIRYQLLYRKEDRLSPCLAAFLTIVRKRFALLESHQ